VNVLAQPPTASLSAPGDGPILAPSVEAPGDGQILAPSVETGGDDQILAHLVQAAPSSSLVLSPGCFVVPSKNASMYGKKMRDVHIAGFSVESDAVIRFRSSDGKVAVADLLVGVGKYVSVSKSQETIFKYLQSKDDKIRDLDIEVDEKLSDEVGRSNLMISLYWYKIIFKFFLYQIPYMGSGTNLVPLIFMVQTQI